MRSDRLNLVLPAWLKEAAKVIAEKRGINLSEYIKDLIKSAVEKNGKKK